MKKMKYYKISKLLNDSTISKFVRKYWIEVNDFSSGQYFVNKNIRIKTLILRSHLCDYSDSYIIAKGRTIATDNSAANRRNIKLTFKINAPFRLCISKINTH